MIDDDLENLKDFADNIRMTPNTRGRRGGRHGQGLPPRMGKSKTLRNKLRQIQSSLLTKKKRKL